MEGFDRASDLWVWFVRLPPLILAITVHEVAHGWVAKQFGDPTAAAGRPPDAQSHQAYRPYRDDYRPDQSLHIFRFPVRLGQACACGFQAIE